MLQQIIEKFKKGEEMKSYDDVDDNTQIRYSLTRFLLFSPSTIWKLYRYCYYYSYYNENYYKNVIFIIIWNAHVQQRIISHHSHTYNEQAHLTTHICVKANDKSKHRHSLANMVTIADRYRFIWQGCIRMDRTKPRVPFSQREKLATLYSKFNE